eukprot:g1301.t1
MELGNISPNGGEGMSGLRGGFGLTGCCQVCPEEFYKELNFLELGDAHKLSVMNKFHGQFGLPAIPDKHARRALDAAAKRAASAVARSRKPHGRSSSLIETSSSLRQQGFMGAMAGALAGGSMPGFARMKTGAPYGKFGGGKCCPVCIGDYLPQPQERELFLQTTEVTRVTDMVTKGTSSNARINSEEAHANVVHDLKEPAESVAEKASNDADAVLEEGGNLPDPEHTTDSAAVETPGTGVAEGKGDSSSRPETGGKGGKSDISAVDEIGSTMVSKGNELKSKVNNMVQKSAEATPRAMETAAASMANGAKTLAEGAKTLSKMSAKFAHPAIDTAQKYARKVAHPPVVNAAKEALLGDVNARPYDGTLDGVKCCQICIQQLYPPRDFVDVQAFLETEDKVNVPAMIEVRHGEARASKSRGRGFVGSVLAGGRSVSVNQYGDSCRCRMCQDNMIGLGGGFFPMPSSNGATRKKSRNPMNKRQYQSLVEVATAARAPVKGGIPLECPSPDKGSTACCYLFCERQFDACKANEEASDRQEDSDCSTRRGTCRDECAVGGIAPKTWGTHNE